MVLGSGIFIKKKTAYIQMIHFRFLSLLFCWQLAGVCLQAQMNGNWGDQGNGTYDATWVPFTLNTVEVTITINGNGIHGSPFKVRIRFLR